MLSRLSVAYLILPYFIFSAGWLKTPLALAFSLILATGYLIFYRSAESSKFKFFIATGQRWNYLLLGIIIIILSIFSGAGSWVQQTGDWHKHSAMLNELLLNDWPVRFGDYYGKSEDWFLCYYFAYYLPAALIGKIGGHALVNSAMFVWTLLGVTLTVLWLLRLSGRNYSWLAIILWTFFSGLDLIGVTLGGGSRDNMEWWAGFAQFSSNTTLLEWVPQHALSGWIATSVIIDAVEMQGSLAVAGFVAALTSLWSPFVTLGLLPLLAVSAIRVRGKGLSSILNLVFGPVILFMIVAFLKSVQFNNIPIYTCFSAYGWPGGVKYWLQFCLLEFLIAFGLLGFFYLRNKNPDAFHQRDYFVTWSWASLVSLLLLPVFHYGAYNDLAMRSSIPGLFLLWLLILRMKTLTVLKEKKYLRMLFVTCLLIGAVQPAMNFASTFNNFDTTPQYQKARVVELGETLLLQYKGDNSSFFARHLLRSKHE